MEFVNFELYIITYVATEEEENMLFEKVLGI